MVNPSHFGNSDAPHNTDTAGNNSDTTKNNTINPHGLVQIGNQSITAIDLKESMEFTPIRSNASNLHAALNTRLEQMITATLLEQEAKKQGIHEQPSIRRKIQQILVQELLNAKVERPIREATITEDEQKLYFEQNRERYERPRQVRVADILIAFGDSIEVARRKAGKVLTEALALQGKHSGFGPLIREYSDTPLTYSKGDTGYFDPTGAPLLISNSLVEAAFELQKVGQISPSLIEAEDGFHVIMLVGKRPALKKSFQSVKHSIATQIRKERMVEEQQFYLKTLRQNNPVQLDENALTELVNEISETSLVQDQASTSFPPQLPQ